MIKIKNKLEDFTHIFKIIENLCVEVDVNFLLDKIYIRAVHPSNHCLIIIEINKNMFEEYSIDKEMVYTLDLQSLNKIFSIVKGKELIIGEKESKLSIKNIKSNFVLNYFVGKKDIRKRPEIETTSKWILNSNDFFNVIENLIQFSSVCKFVSNDELNLHTKSNMVNGIVKLEAKKIDSIECFSYYDLTYVDMIKYIKNIFKELRLGFSKDNPLIIRGTNDYLNFEFILAGRAENDE